MDSDILYVPLQNTVTCARNDKRNEIWSGMHLKYSNHVSITHHKLDQYTSEIWCPGSATTKSITRLGILKISLGSEVLNCLYGMHLKRAQSTV